MPYRHKIIQGLADLINEYGGKGNDPMMKAVWWGIKGQVPSLLQTLDENDEAIAEIRAKLIEVLDVPLPKTERTERVVMRAGDLEEASIGETETPEEKESKAKGKKKKGKTSHKGG